MRLEFAFLAFVLIVMISRLIKNQIFVMLLNMILVYFVFLQDHLIGGAALIAIVCLHYFVLNFRQLSLTIIYLLPLLALVFYKSLPIYAFIGTSYLCFRMLSAAHEINAAEVGKFGLSQYLFYCFYFPTFKLGPIGNLSDHLQSEEIQRTKKWFDLNWIELARILYGAVKYLFFAPVVTYYSQSLGYSDWKSIQTFSALIFMGAFIYIKIYLAFSGFNDIAIGTSRFLSYRMKENFAHPFTTRNVSEFWSNWHISLTDLLKELIFYPMNLKLLKFFGREKKVFIVPFVYVILFVLIGLWHGTGWNFLLMGCFHAAGAIFAFYFSLVMTKLWSGYQKSKFVQIASIALTQIFISLSFVFMENTVEQISTILRQIYLHAL